MIHKRRPSVTITDNTDPAMSPRDVPRRARRVPARLTSARAPRTGTRGPGAAAQAPPADANEKRPPPQARPLPTPRPLTRGSLGLPRQRPATRLAILHASSTRPSRPRLPPFRTSERPDPPQSFELPPPKSGTGSAPTHHRRHPVRDPAPPRTGPSRRRHGRGTAESSQRRRSGREISAGRASGGGNDRNKRPRTCRRSPPSPQPQSERLGGATMALIAAANAGKALEPRPCRRN